jgi:hypothetical protein
MNHQVLNNVICKSFAFVVMALVSTQLIAQSLQVRSTASCYALSDGSYVIGAGPTVFPVMDQANPFSIQTAGITTSGGTVYGSNGPVPTGQWLYFQGVAAWFDSSGWHYYGGSWLRSFNGFYVAVDRLQGGRWVRMEPGGLSLTTGLSNGHIINSQIPVPGPGYYYYGANYYWGPILSTTGAQILPGRSFFQWERGTVHC